MWIMKSWSLNNYVKPMLESKQWEREENSLVSVGQKKASNNNWGSATKHVLHGCWLNGCMHTYIKHICNFTIVISSNLKQLAVESSEKHFKIRATCWFFLYCGVTVFFFLKSESLNNRMPIQITQQISKTCQCSLYLLNWIELITLWILSMMSLFKTYVYWA